MAGTTIVRPRDAAQIAALLELPAIRQLIADLEAARSGGRPGSPVRAMVGAALVKAVYCLPTWTRTARLIAEHATLREVIGAAPSNWACYRFMTKLRDHGDVLAKCIESMLSGLRAVNPEMGKTIAIDGSDMPAWANGHRYLYKNGPERKVFADPDAGWGHRSAISTRKGGAYYGYKLHMAICAETELPLAWTVRAANEPERAEVAGLLDALIAQGFAPGVAVMDKGYDGQPCIPRASRETCAR